MIITLVLHQYVEIAIFLVSVLVDHTNALLYILGKVNYKYVYDPPSFLSLLKSFLSNIAHVVNKHRLKI